jgi:hypothetical protein
MSAGRTAADVGIGELSEQDAAELFDRICRRELHTSGAEFLRSWDAGLYGDVDPDAYDGLPDVLMALPLVREV